MSDIPIVGEPLIRDRFSKCLTSTDALGLKNYRAQKAKLTSRDDRINKLEDEISEIKSLLKQLIDGTESRNSR